MSFDSEYFSMDRLDRLAYQDTFIHRLDSRAKVIAVIFFVLMVVSYPKYEIIELAPLFLFPILLISLGDIPILFLLEKILLVSPFVFFIGMFNPIFDTCIVTVFGMKFSAGWVSFVSLILKCTLTVGAALILIATTSFPGVCRALRRLGLPELFVSQLHFLYRYLFVLIEETMRIVRARDVRSFGKRGRGMGITARLIGVLFLRTFERAERIYRAMLARGFHGEIPELRRHTWTWKDVVFLLLSIGCLAAFRFFPLAQSTGQLVQEFMK